MFWLFPVSIYTVYLSGCQLDPVQLVSSSILVEWFLFFHWSSQQHPFTNGWAASWKDWKDFLRDPLRWFLVLGCRHPACCGVQCRFQPCPDSPFFRDFWLLFSLFTGVIFSNFSEGMDEKRETVHKPPVKQG